MDLIAPQVERLLEQLVPGRAPEMQKMEALAAKTDFPIIGPAAGYFCYLVTRMIGARRVFELGSGFGYSTAWFALAVRERSAYSRSSTRRTTSSSTTSTRKAIPLPCP